MLKSTRLSFLVTYKFWGTPKMAAFASLITYIGVALMCSPVPLLYITIPSGGCKPANYEYLTREQFLHYVYVMNIFVNFLITVSAVTLSSVGTVVKLRQMSKKRNSSASNFTKRDVEITKVANVLRKRLNSMKLVSI